MLLDFWLTIVFQPKTRVYKGEKKQTQLKGVD